MYFAAYKRNQDVDVNLGTRHRAAIGMSEESDAVVVVVSEETGGISVACQGRLNKMEDSDELNSKLERLILPEYSKMILLIIFQYFHQ